MTFPLPGSPSPWGQHLLMFPGKHHVFHEAFVSFSRSPVSLPQSTHCICGDIFMCEIIWLILSTTQNGNSGRASSLLYLLTMESLTPSLAPGALTPSMAPGA